MTVIAARPTTYKGIQMRSRLEAWWAHYLDALEMDWDYEPGAFADGRGQYLPDFRLNTSLPTGAARPVYLELKGVIEDPEPFTNRMEIIWSSEPDATLILMEDHGKRAWIGHVNGDGSSEWMAWDGNPLGTGD